MPTSTRFPYTTLFRSDCADEPVSIGPASPGIETTQKPSSGTVGETFKDAAKISGLFGEHPGGSVSWKLYDNSKCEGDRKTTRLNSSHADISYSDISLN